jgi:hypothetical protein
MFAVVRCRGSLCDPLLALPVMFAGAVSERHKEGLSWENLRAQSADIVLATGSTDIKLKPACLTRLSFFGRPKHQRHLRLLKPHLDAHT